MGTERQEWRYSWIKLQKAMMSLNKYERCTFQVKTRHGCLYMNVSEGNRLSSETCRWHFHFILPIMPDKVAFMSVDGAALCTGNRYIKPLLKRHLVAENEFAFPISLSCCLWSDQCKYRPMFLSSKHICK